MSAGCRGWRLVAAGALVAASAQTAAADPDDLETLLGRAGEQVSRFLDELSDVRCLEDVRQEKLGDGGKVVEERNATYRYFLLLQTAAGSLTVDESREPVQVVADAPGPPMLVSNGFAMLFLVFHPSYSRGFEFTAAGDEVISGRSFRKIDFRHVRGARSPAVLELRGREHPLALAGSAWIEARSGVIARIVASVGDTMTDVGLQSLRVEEDFAPAPFADVSERHWFPQRASIEVATRRQHWRNTHRFKDYKRFSVTTEERIGIE